MLKRNVFALLLLLMGEACVSQTAYWWGMGKKNPLLIDSTTVLVSFRPEITAPQAIEMLHATGIAVPGANPRQVLDDFYACTLTARMAYAESIDSLSRLKIVEMVEPAYTTLDGHAMIVGRDFCVRFRPGVRPETIDSINAGLSVVIDHTIDAPTHEYLLRRTSAGKQTTLQLANHYHDLPYCDYAHPDFRSDIVLHDYTLYDFYNNFQLHMKRIIGKFNDTSVWDFAGLGRTVKVALIDDGVTAHEDLPAVRILPGFNAADQNGNAFPSERSAHGMACAGIIAASHTRDSISASDPNTGVISLNPNAAIIPINIYSHEQYGFLTHEEMAAGIDTAWRRGAAVLSNSWTYPTYHADVDVVHWAIYRARYNGRGGKGCPVIFASGNDNINYLPYPARDPLVFPVGAIKLNDSVWDWSNYSSMAYNSVSVLAPSDDGRSDTSVWSIDQMDTSGVNRELWQPATVSLRDAPPDSLRECACPWDNDDLDYLCVFSGTSAACPLVSGIASLLIARDSMLTADMIEEILMRSAVRDLDWGTLEWVPDTLYGYGRVDAFRAMLSITRGDVNNSAGVIDLSDLAALISYLTGGGFVPFPSVLLGDLNCTGSVDLWDLSYMVSYLVGGGLPPVKPCFAY